MALPADFNKIFGSTATGGLTPIGDVNYAKGWEFVGSNPPTKNDFSYLQNLSDLKSQWLYSNKLQRTNPFGDIKSDGTVPTALANLGLGDAAKRSVGTGANQIPDMSSFTSLTGPVGAISLPGGFMLQWINLVTGPGGKSTVAFPTSFLSEIYSVQLTVIRSANESKCAYWDKTGSTLSTLSYVTSDSSTAATSEAADFCVLAFGR